MDTSNYYLFEYIKSENIDVNHLEKLIDGLDDVQITNNDLNLVETYATTRNPDPEIFKMLLDKKVPICSDIYYGEFYLMCDDYDNDNDNIITNFDNRIGKTALYYYITTRYLFDSKISLDVIKSLTSNSDKVEDYTYNGKTIVQYYVKEPIVERDIFDALFVKNVCNHHDIIIILYEYLNSHMNDIDMYIVNKIINQCNETNVLSLLFNKKNYNSDVFILIIKHFNVQSILRRYLRGSYRVDIDIITCIVDAGAKLLRNKSINDYFYLTSYKKYKDVVEYILKNGISDNEDDNKILICPLLSNNDMSKDILMKILIICIPYVDINEQDSFGNTLLRYAVKLNHVSMVRFILDNGADINIKNIIGNTCLNTAINETELILYENEITDDYGYIRNDNCKKAVKILEMILQELPNIDTMKISTVDLYKPQICDDVFKLCIKYYIIADSDYVCNCMNIPFSRYKDKCIKELNQLKQNIYDNTNILELVYRNKNIDVQMSINNLVKYARNPYFMTRYEVYTEANDFVKHIIEKRDLIDKTIEEISTDDNLFLMLPYDIKYLIISQIV
ncbi:ankyrin-like protein [Borealpox virus]|nr:ankyrin-like protein [Alaskapox virus]